jgi:hypothetical protein
MVMNNKIPRRKQRGILFSRYGCTQGFNIFLTAPRLPRASGFLGINSFGTNNLFPAGNESCSIENELPSHRAAGYQENAAF